MTDTKKRTECERCGTCCMKGGPALHTEDRELLKQEILSRESLITIRCGEPVFLPEQTIPGRNKEEIIKVKGKAHQWNCLFYDEHNGGSCTIYNRRPLECALLKCWDTGELEAVVGKNLLSRFDIISADEEIIELINMHENECSLEILDLLDMTKTVKIDDDLLKQLNDLVNKDLEIRAEAVSRFNLSLDLELFYFGRPLFMILSKLGLIPEEKNGKLVLSQV